MKPSDITRNHTRKKMNEMAEDLDIESPSSYKNKTELAKAMIPEIEKKMDEENIPEAIEKIDEIVDSINNSLLDMSKFKSDFEVFKNKYKSGIWYELSEFKDNLLENGDVIVEIDEKLNAIENMQEEGFLNDEIEVITTKTKDGDYKSALEIVEEALEGVEEAITEKSKLKEEVEEKISQLKSKLAELRGTKFKLDLLKDLLRESVKAQKNKEYKQALENIEIALDQAKKLELLHEKIMDGKELIKQLKEKGLGFQSYLDMLKTCKQKGDEGDYKYALQMLDDAITDMRKEFETVDDLQKKLSEVYKKMEAIERALMMVRKDINDILEERKKNQ